MLLKIATVISALVTALVLSSAPVDDGGPAGYPVPASETAPDYIAPPTATPVALVCLRVEYIGYARACAEFGPPPIVLPATPHPAAYPAP